jgi:hypothetical protein
MAVIPATRDWSFRSTATSLTPMGTVILGGVLAIVAAAAGSTLTFYTQHHVARRAERFAVAEQMRAERLAAFSAFAGAAMEARRAQVDRWYQLHDGGRESSAYIAAKNESYRAKALAWQALFRAQLVSDSTELTALAAAALEGIGSLHRAAAKDELDHRAEGVRESVGAFVAAAREHLNAPTEGVNAPSTAPGS